MDSHTKRFIAFFLAIFSSFTINSAAIKGVVLEQESYLENNPERKGRGLIYISDNKIKFVADNSDPVIIFDLNKNKLYIIDNVNKQYIESSPQKYVDLIQKNLIEDKKQLKKDIANLPKEQRDQKLKLLEHKGINIDGDEKPIEWVIKKTDETKVVAGLSAQKIELFEDGKLIQKLWVSNELDEIDYKKLAKFYGEIQKISQGKYLGYDNQNKFGEALSDIYKEGYPLKTVDYNLPGNRVETILSIKDIDISDKDFSPPKDYKKTKI